MEGFKSQKKVACFKEGGQVGYKARNNHAEEKEMVADVKQDKAIVKKGVAQHEEAKHKGEPKTELKLKTGGRAKKEKGTVKKYCGGGKAKKYADGGSVTDTERSVFQKLKDNVMGTPAQNAAAQKNLDKVAKGQGAISDAERAIRSVTGQGSVSDAERTVAKKRGGKC
jgi:hypothetical protein